MKELEDMARNCCTIPAELGLYEKGYVIALRGLYCQYEHELITLDEARRQKEVLVRLYSKQNEYETSKHMKLNKKQVIDAVILEVGRYISCASYNRDREKNYPRALFEKRIVQMIDEAYSWNVSC